MARAGRAGGENQSRSSSSDYLPSRKDSEHIFNRNPWRAVGKLARLFAVGVARALRIAQKGDRARGIKRDPEDAMRLEAAIDYFIAEFDKRKKQLPDYDGLVLK